MIETRKISNRHEIFDDSKDDTLPSDFKPHFKYDLNVLQHIKEIYFGPKFTDTQIGLFDAYLKYKNLHGIECKKTTNPFDPKIYEGSK